MKTQEITYGVSVALTVGGTGDSEDECMREAEGMAAAILEEIEERYVALVGNYEVTGVVEVNQ